MCCPNRHHDLNVCPHAQESASSSFSSARDGSVGGAGDAVVLGDRGVPHPPPARTPMRMVFEMEQLEVRGAWAGSLFAVDSGFGPWEMAADVSLQHAHALSHTKATRVTTAAARHMTRACSLCCLTSVELQRRATRRPLPLPLSWPTCALTASSSSWTWGLTAWMWPRLWATLLPPTRCVCVYVCVCMKCVCVMYVCACACVYWNCL